MKNILISICLIVTTTFMMFSCDFGNGLIHENNSNGENSILDNESTKDDELNNGDESSNIIIDVSSKDETYSFETYEQLEKDLQSSSTKLISNKDSFSTVYKNLLEMSKSGQIKVLFPQLDGKNISLLNKEGYYNIVLHTRELYSLPWICYFCTANEQEFIVNISYLSAIGDENLNKASTYYEALKIIAPNAPSPENYQKYSSYSRIYEATINLANGKEVIALISELKSDSRIFIQFIYDGVMVLIRGNADLFTESFWSSFGFSS